MVQSEWAKVSIRTPGPPGTLKTWITPGDGTNVSGSSALIRHSIEWPVKTTSACLKPSRSPAAIRICALTMSMPVTISVTGCSTWRRVLASMK